MILIRHAQSEFNVIYAKTRIDPGIRDPRITDHGRNQAHAAAERLARLRESRPNRVTRIVASPYWRTLETAEIVSAALDLPVSVDPLVGEHAAFTSDLGSPAADLRAQWPEIDFSHMEDEWWPQSKEEERHVQDRAARFRDQARDLADYRDVLIVSHWGFIRALTGVETPNCGILSFDPHAPHPTGGELVHDEAA